MTTAVLDPWFAEQLVCPIDRGSLHAQDDGLSCREGHSYPCVDGVPVMMLPDAKPTIAVADRSRGRAMGLDLDTRAPELYLESLSISEEEKRGILDLAERAGSIDPVVAYLVAATNGLMYKHLIGTLDQYPIPELGLPPGAGRRLLDVGCSWGRWSIAAHRRGYDVIGIDPSLGAIMAARRVARQLGVPSRYLVADARHLPFRDASVDVAYSYSVLQHLSPVDATAAVAEMGRVLKPDGLARVQMPTRFGIRCLYHQCRRSFRTPTGFEVRYWTLAALSSLFARHVGAVRFEADCYFGIGLQPADAALMPASLRSVLWASERLKSVSRWCRPLIGVADSVFVEARARGGHP